MSKAELRYHICPACSRSVPAAAMETYCPNDGSKMLDSCPGCGNTIRSPYHRFCSTCGAAYPTGLATALLERARR